MRARPRPEIPGFIRRLQRLECEEHARGEPAPAGQTNDRPVFGVLAVLEVPDAHVVERTPRLKHHAADHQSRRGHKDRVGDARRAHPPVAVQPGATQLIPGQRPIEHRCEHLAIHQRSEEEVGHDAR